VGVKQPAFPTTDVLVPNKGYACSALSRWSDCQPTWACAARAGYGEGAAMRAVAGFPGHTSQLWQQHPNAMIIALAAPYTVDMRSPEKGPTSIKVGQIQIQFFRRRRQNAG
jgi:hypothetical protein